MAGMEGMEAEGVEEMEGMGGANEEDAEDDEFNSAIDASSDVPLPPPPPPPPPQDERDEDGMDNQEGLGTETESSTTAADYLFCGGVDDAAVAGPGASTELYYSDKPLSIEAGGSSDAEMKYEHQKKPTGFMALFWGWEPTVSEDTDDPAAWTDMMGTPTSPVPTDEEGDGTDLLAAAAAADHWGKESGGDGTGDSGAVAATKWRPMTNDDTDAEGWKYGTSFHRLDAPREGGRDVEKSSDVVRRRCWVRA